MLIRPLMRFVPVLTVLLLAATAHAQPELPELPSEVFPPEAAETGGPSPIDDIPSLPDEQPIEGPAIPAAPADGSSEGDGEVTTTTTGAPETAAAPEPSSLALLGLGSIGLAAWRRSRRNRPA